MAEKNAQREEQNPTKDGFQCQKVQQTPSFAGLSLAHGHQVDL